MMDDERVNVGRRPINDVEVERTSVFTSGMQLRDLIRWGPVFAGFFVALSVSVLLGVLGAALGLGGATASAIWGAITLIVAFFVGGWVASRTTPVTVSAIGLITGFAVWAVTLVILLVLSAIGAAGLLNSEAISPVSPGAIGANPSAIQGAAWGTFIALLLGLIAALVGGWVGTQGHEMETRVPR